MSLLSDLPKLAELEKRQASAKYETTALEYEYECEMLNAAPAMLTVLVKFQPGDAAEIRIIMSMLAGPHNTKHYETLRRFWEACQLMEAP